MINFYVQRFVLNEVIIIIIIIIIMVALLRNGSIVKLFLLNIEKDICMKRKLTFIYTDKRQYNLICDRSVEQE